MRVSNGQKEGDNIQPILKYPGAKWNLSEWIISHFPQHEVYLEPYFGSGAVFFNKQPSRLETINDIDGDIVNLFRVIRERPKELSRMIEYTPWSREEYYASYERTGDNLEDARRFFVRCWQAHATKTNGKTGWRHSTTKNGPIMPRQWTNVPNRIKEVADRLKNAQIENMLALDLIQKYNNPDVLVYADPTYLLKTRTGKLYKHEMSDEDHEELLETLKEHQGAVILSGYDNDLYNTILDGWEKKTRSTVTEKGGAKKEVIWINYKAMNRQLKLSV